MVQINCIGNVFGTDGYSVHTRNLANALNKLTNVRLSTQLVPNWERNVTDRELDMIKRKPIDDEINLIITSPVYWKLNCGKRNFAFLVFEGDKVPKHYIELCLNPEIEKILVPSEHTKKAIVNTLASINFNEDRPVTDLLLVNKIKVISHGVNLDLFYPKDKPKKVTFLCNKGWRHNQDRGGMQYAIKAYLEEFTDKDDIELILKINPAYGIPNIQMLIEQLTEKRTGLPKVTVDTNSYKYEDLVKLYNSANVLLMPTRAEAFGIPGIEAMACGLPVITTNFGGQTDFCNENNGWIIGGELTEVKWELQYEGIKWLTPDIVRLRQVMREIYSNPEIIAVKGSNALETASKWQWSDSAKKLIELL